ncbi:hypothetical protein ROM48_17775 [Cronobacter malonaticus]|uniref:hypothetical protein n=1 Tax=Cronobacter malonaticus TaxID=413503 RepID=UPI000CFE2B07|nr:hypothetical protein [Cronobacter malonaticus]MDT3537866.1 hypothetical protein [Cronobacter malonaticus]
MTHYWWKDLHDRNDAWLGLALTVKGETPAGLALEMLSGHHGRMALQLRGETLFWASMLKDYSGVWLVTNREHPDQLNLLPPVRSEDIEAIKRKGDAAWTGEWCRYFARQLMDSPAPLLAPRDWLLRPMLPAKRHSSYLRNTTPDIDQWYFKTPPSAGDWRVDWALYGEDFRSLTDPEHVRLVDWWWGGHLLMGRYPIDPHAGRLKWWRKKCREGELPPVLVWYIAGLASYVVLDGHYRLHAAMEEGIPPSFLVLSEYAEREFPVDEAQRERVQRALALQQANNPGCNIDGINQTLINLWDRRYLYAETHSRATLGNGEGWAREVTAYLRRHGQEAYLENVLNGTENPVDDAG